MNKPKTFLQLAHAEGMASMEHVIRRGKQLQRLEMLVRGVLPVALRGHCRLANIRGATMVLLVDSTVWATRVRYLIPALLEELQQQEKLRKITEIQLKVEPLTATDEPLDRPARRATMSRDAARCVEQCAASIDDAPLRAALQQLARRRTNEK